MNTYAAAFWLLPVAAFAANPAAQKTRTPLDDYIDTAETIVIARCLSSGPVNIMLKSMVDLDVLLVVKGDPNLKKLSKEIGGGLIPGETFLMRFPDYKKTKEKSAFGTEGANVIPVSRDEKIEELKLLSPRIVVLRTINLRVDRLENRIRHDTYEMGALKVVKKGN